MTTHTTLLSRSPRVWLLAVLISSSVALVACGGPSAEVSDAAPDPMPDTMNDAQVKADEARARLMASEGGQMVLDAIEKHGGLEAWYAAPTSAYTWEYSNLGSQSRFKTSLVADNTTRRIYHRILTLGTPDAVEEIDGRMAWDGENAWISPASIEAINPRFWAATGYYFESMPFIFADPGVNFKVFPPEEHDGINYDRVTAYYDPSVGDTPGDTYTLFINPGTGMLDVVLYTVTYGRPYQPGDDWPPAPTRGRFFRYSDYVTVDGLTVPTRFRGYEYSEGEVGEFRNEAWAADFSFTQPFDESQLAMPADGRMQPYELREQQ